MECDPDYSMKTFYELCESRLYKGIGEEISGEWRDEEWRNIYDASWRKQEGDLFFWWRNEVKLLDFHDN